MGHRGQWSEHEARGVLSAWRRSGLSIEKFARRFITPQRVRWWKAKLEGKSTAIVRSSASLSLLPVQVTEAAPSKRGEPVAVYLRSGHIMKVGRGFDEENEQVLKRNPNEGHLSVFVGKRRDMLKILFWDKNGYVVYFKRLERGRSSCRSSTRSA